MPNYLRMDLRGHAGADSVERVSKTSQKPFVTFSVGIGNNDKNNPQTTWVNVLVFKEVARAQARFVKRGTCVHARGMPFASTYNGRNGQVPTLNMFADEIYVLDWHKRGEMPDSYRDPTDAQNSPAPAESLPPEPPPQGENELDF